MLVLRKMDVRCILILLLFQTLVAWCSAKFIVMPKVEYATGDVEEEIQDSIRNFIHTGLYSHVHLDPSQLQVTTPVKVTRDGRLVSRAVAHAHEHGHARARRDLRGAEHALPHAVHYNLTVDGRELRLDLRPSVSFIAPALVVERHGDGERTRHRPHGGATGCHYTGSVRGQPESRVALSACDGLAGLLRTEHGEYWIEPSNQAPSDDSAGRPHVIFKRSAVDKVEAYHRKKRAANYKTDNNEQTKRYYEREYQKFHPRRNTNTNVRRNHDSKESADRRSREYERLKRLENARKNPIAFRAEMQRRRENRINQSLSKSNSIESSNSRSVEMPYVRNGRKKMNRRRGDGQKKHRRRRRKAKNCATKQPPYTWNITSVREYDRTRNNYIPNQRASGNAPRRPRSVSKPQHVEVLLVADKSMTEFHQDNESLETYLLTIMNMVSDLYKDRSIGNLIQVVVVKIVTLQNSRDLQVSTNADTTLSLFCHWQQQLNPINDSHPQHHDVAILVTRQDICSLHNQPCNTLGVAHVAGMCIPDRSCSVNEDNGIMLAHTITHELGHNFGLYHDTEKIGCSRREGSTLHIMTPVFEADSVQVAWSRCSKRDVTNFLDNGFGECLGDEPSTEIDKYKYPELPAGVMYDATKQCVLQFGTDATVCTGTDPEELCQHLWCLVNGTCKSMLRPAASGTTCGIDMWCQNQKCVPRERPPEARDGGWGEWSEWSECSRTCGGGVEIKTRECDNPMPSNNGKYCVGDRSRYRTCNREKCPINEPLFRDVQCAKYNNKMDKNNDTVIADWVSFYDQDKPCELQCVPRNSNDYEILPGYVADGTPCWQTIAGRNSRDMCISGVCYKVGCDWVVGSELEEDACGICGGDGSACKTVQGIYSKGTTKQSGFTEVAVIPAGSRNVKIQEKVSPGNYISIGSARTRKLLLNGGGARNATLTEYFVAGSQAIYERDRDWEKVQIVGPILEDIKVYQRIYRGNHRNPGVNYQYTVSKKYRYRLSDWSPCSATCGRGRMYRQHECVTDSGHKVDPSHCDQQEQFSREALVQICMRPPCTMRTHWRVDSWQRCNTSCRIPGKEPTKHRRVYCVDNLTGQRRSDADCDLAMKPISTIICADIPPC